MNLNLGANNQSLTVDVQFSELENSYLLSSACTGCCAAGPLLEPVSAGATNVAVS